MLERALRYGNSRAISCRMQRTICPCDSSLAGSSLTMSRPEMCTICRDIDISRQWTILTRPCCWRMQKTRNLDQTCLWRLWTSPEICMKHLHKHVKNYLGYAGHHHGHPDFDLGLTCGACGAEFSFVQAPKIQNGRKGCSWQLVCATMRWMQMVVMTAIRIMVLTMLMMTTAVAFINATNVEVYNATNVAIIMLRMSQLITNISVCNAASSWLRISRFVMLWISQKTSNVPSEFFECPVFPG